ncbi:hypothetical protein FQA39_LY06918 [Lamprigera yunnana]|nr:hypothetical protein FQA39_LY06918 [Lamprigera yunnana]
MKNVKEELQEADCFAIQVDRSVDKYGVDNKFISIRLSTKSKETKSVFLGLTTDRENANTGKNSGLPVRTKDYLQRDILCMWCVAHRSDLVFFDVEMNVTEVDHFYRGSDLRFEELQKIASSENKTVYRFPAYFEVRLAEHLINYQKSFGTICLRLSNDQQDIVSKLKTFVNLRNAPEMISTMSMDVANLFGADSVETFADDVIALHAPEKLPSPSAILYHFLKV